MTKESNREAVVTATGEQGSTKVARQRKQDSILIDLFRVPRLTRKQVVWTIRIAVLVVVALFGVLLFLYVMSLLPGVTLMGLLRALAIPITLGAVVPLLGWLQSKRELEIENQRAETDRQIAAQGRQDGMLQAYIDQIGQLLLDKDRPLLKSTTAREVRTETDGDEVRTLARARTLTVLPGLDGERKRSVLQFLYESHLVIKGHVVVALRGADLRGAELSATNLREAHLTDAYLHAAAPYQGPEHQARRCPGLRGPTRRRLRCGVAGLSVRALVASAAHGTHT
jgi:hypothetical protein